LGLLKLTSFLVAFVTFNSIGQCRFEKNEIDQVTKEKVIITKFERILFAYDRIAKVRFAADGSGTYIILDYSETVFTNFNPHTVNEGQEIILFLEDETTITGKAISTIKGRRTVMIGLPPSYTFNIKSLYYSISDSDLRKLSKEKVVSLGYYLTENRSDEGYREFDLKPNPRFNMQAAAGCLVIETLE
jgi:outer membrane lipoprotein-sorting protein